jgi:dihydropteroate synthase
MGVVNVTPDSFSDGGRLRSAEDAIAYGLRLVREGADIVDVGGEATNPRAVPVSADVELGRVLPVIEALAGAGATVSIDTTKAEVARAAIAAGATIVNDISGGRFDPAMASAVDDPRVTYIVGHLRGDSLAAVFASEGTVGWQDVADELAAQLAKLPEAARARAWVDPGLGFGKGSDPEGNVDLIRHVGDLAAKLPGHKVVVGPSRKRFLRRMLGPAGEVSEAALDAGSVAACLAAGRAGAHVLRVHNVALLRAALTVYTKI